MNQFSSPEADPELLEERRVGASALDLAQTLTSYLVLPGAGEFVPGQGLRRAFFETEPAQLGNAIEFSRSSALGPLLEALAPSGGLFSVCEYYKERAAGGGSAVVPETPPQEISMSLIELGDDYLELSVTFAWNLPEDVYPDLPRVRLDLLLSQKEVELPQLSSSLIYGDPLGPETIVLMGGQNRSVTEKELQAFELLFDRFHGLQQHAPNLHEMLIDLHNQPDPRTIEEQFEAMLTEPQDDFVRGDDGILRHRETGQTLEEFLGLS